MRYLLKKAVLVSIICFLLCLFYFRGGRTRSRLIPLPDDYPGEPWGPRRARVRNLPGTRFIMQGFRTAPRGVEPIW